MARSSRFGRLLALLLAGSASALPAEAHMAEQREVAHGAPSPWVTVDSSGQATTITPTVTSVNGAPTTISPPPAALTETGTYTLSPTSAAVTTSTGLPPVATASSSNGDGMFLACNAYQGADAPFCQPKSGSKLNPGKTYYVTWSDTYFANSSTTIEIQGTYHDGSDTHSGFTSPRMPASKEFFVWAIPDDFLSSRNPPLTSLNVSLAIAYFLDLYGNDVEDVSGPTVIVTSSEDSQADSGNTGHKTNVAAIAVPVIVVVVLVVLAGLCFFSWRRHGTVPVLGALTKRRSTGIGGGGGQGYGVRQSRAERVGAGGGATGGFAAAAAAGGDRKGAVGGGVELVDRDSWSPDRTTAQPGRNVFREEMERQERVR
ncbi:hypothetical protein NKR19_g5743 [Coniochaeta hoffmannii]|uniref:Mid2 domain-containing protein n=1 Tax=Coniochaeta hoffmannii TaxID=91930 RepID=A0AA38RIB3_9PEZI|nr:hypothetical protein NKR19_g5743 [Coniochaeta hoffmannii]